MGILPSDRSIPKCCLNIFKDRPISALSVALVADAGPQPLTVDIAIEITSPKGICGSNVFNANIDSNPSKQAFKHYISELD